MALRSLLDVPAPAKLNLFLHVVGRRPDGYHRLQSLFALIDWSDTLHFERRDDGLLRRHDLSTALPADDLCLRAARLLQSASGTPFGVDIAVDKRVPAGAGMGGGSSDAASTLLALNRLWAIDWPRSRLLELGLRLGADVPFFIGGRNALVEGIGERLVPVSLPRHVFAVVKPSASIETRLIFGHPLLERSAETDIIESFTAGELGSGTHRNVSVSDRVDAREGSRANPPVVDMQAVGRARNDLERAARAVCDEVGQAGLLLERAFGNSRMTGSGSAVFADLGPVGVSRAQALPALPGRWQGRICHGLDRHPLAGWAVDRG